MGIDLGTPWVVVLLTFVTFNVVVSWLWRSYQDHLADRLYKSGVCLEVIVDRDDTRDPFAIEQMWNNLHSINQQKGWRAWFRPQPVISYEIYSVHDESKRREEISFRFWVPEEHKEALISRLRAIHPNAQVHEIDPDYIPSVRTDDRIFAACEMQLKHHHALALRPYDDFTKSDPLNAITSAMAELEDREEMFLQVVMRPIDESAWRDESKRIIRQYEITGKKPRPVNPGWRVFKAVMLPIVILGNLVITAIKHLAKPDRMDRVEYAPADTRVGLIERAEQRSMSMKALTHHGYVVKIRLLVVTPYGQQQAKARLNALMGSFNEVEADNALIPRRISKYELPQFVERMRKRHLANDERRNIISTIEIAAICHLPGPENLIPGIKRISAKDYGRPASTRSVDYFARDSRGNLIGLDAEARMRHLFIIGMTGVGKSTLLERMIINDIHAGRGVILLDPHGDLAEAVIEKINTDRPDIYIFRPFDWDYPVGLNILEIESIDPDMREMEKQLVVDSFITTLKRVFPPDSIGPSSEDFFRMAASALVDQPEGASFLEVLLMLTSHSYREKAKEFISTPQVKHYWEVNFPQLISNRNTQALLAAPLNKTRRFVADRMISKIICQLESTLNIKNIMDSGGVLICNLSQGLCGEENSRLLGAMLLAKIQIAAMMRAPVPFDQRTPCFVYVDEFQNFVGGSESAAKSFEKVLSEARKYRLSLTMANQYLGQIPPHLRDAIFGNCGSIISFRVGPTDAEFLEKYFSIGERRFTKEDLMLLEKYQVAARLMADNLTGPPMTAYTLPPVEPHENANPDLLMKRSREDIGVPRKEVEDDIMRRMREYDRSSPEIE